MTTISRLNATINNHTVLANAIAFGLLATVSLVSAAAITHTGQLIQASYDTLTVSAPVNQKPVVGTPASKVQASPISASPLTIQSQQPNAISQLQPAQGAIYATNATANSLQPNVNDVQLAGANPQNAAGL